MMGKPLLRLAAAGLAVVAVFTAPSVSSAAATPGPTATRATEHTEVLINGDRVLAGGSRAYTLLPAGSGFAYSTMIIRRGSHAYEVPDAAFPYLGRGLDPSLFDVTSLPRTGTLPVTITYRGATAPALPGVTISRASGGTASGYLTPASARIFGAALMRQFARDHAAGAYGTDGLFADGTTIRLAGSRPATAPRRPAFPMHTLTATGTGLDGRPDTGDFVAVYNMDNFGYFGSIVSFDQPFYHGVAKFSVPSGHYAALGAFATFNSARQPVGWRVVATTDFTVTGNRTVALDERTATTPVSVTVPRPATPQFLMWTLRLVDGTGSTSSYGFDSLGAGTPVYINRASGHPGAGSLRDLVYAHLASPPATQSPYTYDVSFAGPTDTIPAHFTAAAANLATVNTAYYSDITQSGYLWRSPLYAFNAREPFFPTGLRIPAPLRRTEYMSAGNPVVYWVVAPQYYANDQTGGGGQFDVAHSYAAGQHATENWNGYPLHSPLNTSVLGNKDIIPTYVSATRAGDVLSFDISPFGDNTTGHQGEGFWPGDTVSPPGGITGSYELDQNGIKIAGGNADRSAQGVMGFLNTFKVSPAAATFRLTLNASRAVKPYVLSTKLSTTWTWRSAHESGTTLPAGWICTDGTDHSCASEPLMTLDYAVASLGIDGVAPAGAQVVKITVAHQQLAPAAATSGVSASFSVDGGRSWQPAIVKGSGTTWYASFNAPAGTKVWLTTTATDTAGGAITETIGDAYAVSSSQATAGYRQANCAAPASMHVTCFLAYSPQTTAARAAASFGTAAAPLTGPAGWGATAIQHAYKLPVTRSGATVAVVELFDTPKLEAYLNAYRKQYGLPPCTTANGCFRKVNEHGATSPLPPNGTGTNWDLEATLDVDMVSAACPKCHILVVEGQPRSWADFASAENTAARLRAVAISNSYGTPENGPVQVYAAAYNHPGHAIVVASGDYGFDAANFPANLATVTAAGGTQLSAAHNGRGYSEAVWNTPGLGAGASGCSAYVAKPVWQHDTHCPGRTVADVSAVASDIAIYEPYYAPSGWLTVDGTSASSPLIAGIYALAGNATTVRPGDEYSRPGAFFDVTTGNNDWWNGTGGTSCGHDYLCVAKPAYDAPTGLGTPNGITGF